MAETVDTGCGSTKKWRWYNVANDLQTQGGLSDVFIDPLSFHEHDCCGTLGDKPFLISWLHKELLMVSMVEYSQSLVDAFSKVVEYKPFCQYQKDGVFTVEWNTVAEQREEIFAELRTDPSVTKLNKLL